MSNKNEKKRKVWSKRFSEPVSKNYLNLGSSIHFDKELYKQDIQGSKAHVKMLESIGVISRTDLKNITSALDKVQKEIEKGTFQFRSDLEDIHTNIEYRVTELAGEAGAKIHTGRSRNDQIITDTMIWLRENLKMIQGHLIDLLNVIIEKSNMHIDTVLPGFTHLQVAQPVRLAHHLLAYYEKFLRDLRRLDFALDSIKELPLGVGAISGVNYKTDRADLAEILGFKEVSRNSMDTVSNRDWILDFHHFASTLFIHLSSFSEELILWASQEFQFVRLSDKVTTGSSLMPQKRNPDVAELVRGKTGRIIGNHISLLIVLKGLPLTYNRDLQEDKESLFDSINTIILSLKAFTEMIDTASFLPENMKKSLAKGFALATDLADYLVKKGMAFRKSHETTGQVIRHLESGGRSIEDLSLDELKRFSPLFETDVFQILDYNFSMDSKKSVGSTSKDSVIKQIAGAKKTLTKLKINKKT